MKFIILTVLLILLSGCGKSGYTVFTHDRNYYSSLNASQKTQMRENGEIEAIISASYLNTLYPQTYNDNNETFLIGLYIANPNKDEDKQGLFNPNYHVRLNNKAPFEIVPVKRDSKLVRKTSFTDRWSYYYIVKFNEQRSTKLFLQLVKNTINYENNISEAGMHLTQSENNTTIAQIGNNITRLGDNLTRFENNITITELRNSITLLENNITQLNKNITNFKNNIAKLKRNITTKKIAISFSKKLNEE